MLDNEGVGCILQFFCCVYKLSLASNELKKNAIALCSQSADELCYTFVYTSTSIYDFQFKYIKR